MLNISIPIVRILDDHAEYGVSCGLHQQQQQQDGNGNGEEQLTVVWRRYRDFEALKESLSHYMVPLPLLPPKYTWWTSRSPAVVKDRQKQLEHFLRQAETRLTQNYDGTWLIFCNFIGISAPMAANAALVATTGVTEGLSELEKENSALKLNLEVLEQEKKNLLTDLAKRDQDIKVLDEEREVVKNQLEQLLKDNEVQAEKSQNELKLELDRSLAENRSKTAEIISLNNHLEESTPKLELLETAITQLKKEKSELELEIARLETAQQSAAAYGASVLSRLEQAEKERNDLAQKFNQLNEQFQNTAQNEAIDQNIVANLRDRISQLEKELSLEKEESNRLSSELDVTNEGAEKVVLELKELKKNFEQQDQHFMEARTELSSLRTELASKQSPGDFADKEIQSLKGQLEQYVKATEQNATIKRKLAERVENLIDENQKLKEKNVKLEERMRLFQGD